MLTIYQLTIRVLLVTVLCMMTVVPATTIYATEQDVEKKHVLFILAFTPDYVMHELYIKGLKSTLEQNPQYKFSYSYEYLDYARHSHEQNYFENIGNYLKVKYENNQPNYIVTAANISEIMLNYGADIFPNVPVIVEINRDIPESLIPDNYIMTPRRVNIEKNIQLILQTNPLTKKIYIAIGNSTDEQNTANHVSQMLATDYKNIDYEIMNNLTYEQMLQRVSSTEDYSAILYIRWLADVSGRSFIPEDVIEAIGREANAPVYGTSIQFMGSGIVGGYMSDVRIVGQLGAQAILRMVEGESPSDIKRVQGETSIYTFDWRQLQRWNIANKNLPADSVIEYKVITVWEQYGEYIATAIALLTLQGFLIFALLLNKRKRKKAEDELTEANISLLAMTEKLIVIDKMKDEFLLNTSHELQTPLHGIINISETMMEGNYGQLTHPQKEELQIILAISRRLSTLIKDIIDLEKIKRNDIQLDLAPTNVKSAIVMVVDVFEYLTKNKNIEIVVDVPEGLPMVYVDENRLWQVLFNLIGNAVKFTAKGTITISAREDSQSVKLSIEDSGIGIPVDRQGQIFNSFTQADVNISSQYGGSGLGLFISSQLVERMDGHISLDWSELGKGARFTIVLPRSKKSNETNEIAETSELSETIETNEKNNDKSTLDAVHGSGNEVVATVEKSERLHLHSFRILAVDDESTNLRVLESIFSGDAYELITATSGIEALEELNSNSNRPIDLVLMDVMMPRMSGYETCKKIRENYSPFDLPILIVTARNTIDDITAGFEAGANDFISKPFYTKELRARVDNLLLMKRSVQESLKNEMAFLQAQISPHFIYNTLHTISSFCIRDGEKAYELLIKFSQYLRNSFDFKNLENFTLLEKELDFVTTYVELEKARYGDRIQIHWDIQVDADSIKIPTLILQPLVENAIRHGVVKKIEGGTVVISVVQSETDIHFKVKDNGVGIPAQDIQKLFLINRGQGVGLRNIHSRLQKLYNRGITITSNNQDETEVAFAIPIDQIAIGGD